MPGKDKGSPFHITEMRPIQLARFDFDEYCEGRRAFTTDQWMDALVRSAGSGASPAWSGG